MNPSGIRLVWPALVSVLQNLAMFRNDGAVSYPFEMHKYLR